MTTHCPNCGKKLLVISTTTLYFGDETRPIFREVLNQATKFKEMSKDVSNSGMKPRTEIYFMSCHKCERLYLYYGNYGYYFENLGKLTEEAIAIYISNKLEK